MQGTHVQSLARERRSPTGQSNGAHVLLLPKSECHDAKAWAPWLESPCVSRNTPPDTVQVPQTTTKTQRSQIKKETLDQLNKELTVQYADTRGSPHYTAECWLQL